MHFPQIRTERKHSEAWCPVPSSHQHHQWENLRVPMVLVHPADGCDLTWSHSPFLSHLVWQREADYSQEKAESEPQVQSGEARYWHSPDLPAPGPRWLDPLLSPAQKHGQHHLRRVARRPHWDLQGCRGQQREEEQTRGATAAAPDGGQSEHPHHVITANLKTVTTHHLIPTYLLQSQYFQPKERQSMQQHRWFKIVIWNV